MNVAGIEVGGQAPLVLIAGPCVVESEALALEVAQALKETAAACGVPLIFKASFDKANRTSSGTFRGIGFERGLAALARVRRELGVPVLTDVHERTPLDEVAAAVDVLQTPAMLCRQTDFIAAVASQGRPVNLKKGQFLAPDDMRHVVAKARATGNDSLLVCERGASFGYHDLVADMRSLAVLRGTGCPVVFDATHAVQRPGALNGASGGDRAFVPVLARAAVAAGIAAVFIETHPRPDEALSDGPTSWPLAQVGALLAQLREIDAVVKARPYLESQITAQ
jgi:2-dehydro-3-deoxyphosphooctonate aldolase (KDO 8-P synthase)